MIWRRWVTESSSSAPQTSSDHLDRWFSNTRMRPPQSGLVQVGLSEADRDCSHLTGSTATNPFTHAALPFQTHPPPSGCFDRVPMELFGDWLRISIRRGSYEGLLYKSVGGYVGSAGLTGGCNRLPYHHGRRA